MTSHSVRSGRSPRLAAFIAALCVLVAALAACGGSDSSSGKVTIRFSYLWAGFPAQQLEKVIADFNKSQDKIFVKGISNPDTQAQLASMTASNGSFDISDTYGWNTGAWGSKGIMEPLDQFIKKDNYDLSDFVPAALDQGKYQGKVYALPLSANDYALLYNKKLLSKAGISAPPKTMGEMADDIATLTRLGKDGKLKQLGFASMSAGASIDYRTWAMLFGGHWYDEAGNPTPADPGNIEAANWYVGNVIKKYGVKNVQRFASGFGDVQSPQNPFYSGKLAMVMGGEWQSSFIQKFAPDLDWGAVPLPYPDDRPDLANTTNVVASTWFIPRNAQHKQEAWEFMKYLESKEPMLQFTKAISNLPARTSLLDDSTYDSLPHFDVWLDLLGSENAQSMPSAASYSQYQSDLGRAEDAITRLTKTPEDAYMEVAKAVQNYG